MINDIITRNSTLCAQISATRPYDIVYINIERSANNFTLFVRGNSLMNELRASEIAFFLMLSHVSNSVI